MEIVILTAFGVGGATLLGALIGLVFKKTSKAFGDGALSFAAGVMLAAAMLGLILPSIEYGGRYGVIICTLGIFIGALCVNLLDLLLIRIFNKRLSPTQCESGERIRRVLLFVAVIGIHNLPEGIAAGVGFGTGDPFGGIFIATAIALQNIPEGMAVIVAMLGVGMKKWRTFCLAAVTGVVEIIGTFIGYFAVNLSEVVLPFALAFAGGNMLYVIADEMIPHAHTEDNSLPTYLILSGFCLMLIFNAIF